MVPPCVVVKDSMSGAVGQIVRRSAAAERLVDAILVVISSELFQLSPQIPIFANLRATFLPFSLHQPQLSANRSLSLALSGQSANRRLRRGNLSRQRRSKSL
jgi:hypothetical protein